MNGTHKQIFIVITQTGTMLSRITTALTKRLLSPYG